MDERAHATLTKRAQDRVEKSGTKLTFAAAYSAEAERDPALYARAVGGAPDPRLVAMAAEKVAATKE